MLIVQLFHIPPVTTINALLRPNLSVIQPDTGIVAVSEVAKTVLVDAQPEHPFQRRRTRLMSYQYRD
jgi:hypothetical protein